MIEYGNHSRYENCFSVDYSAWVIELYYYSGMGDVSTCLLQTETSTPDKFSSEQQAIEFAEKFLKDGMTTMEVIGFAAKKIHVLKIIKEEKLAKFKIREKDISDTPSASRKRPWSKFSYVAASKEDAFTFFGIPISEQVYWEVLELPYRGNKPPGTKMKG